mmetsp:Transcript_2400/g.3384  ORF Transcript_2400/g.3384 Transcript_2400/m.3384 type:complete len:264 (-) Transcript_2400:556-1347(-)|eukprot:CAMPEP_0117752550 /NCGR_PEP_ID=MMETSP0947-20121206/11674_1 /TAXON_ID=44440 /ORGANISM="Chattonella subsalsa, Strain CCMP2191" /LENGTH=263 /DNA_ID=CAMNT_0005571217 /DNA_START=313 /DNA_END=1104 /DNA_ORIENTATION=-
MSEENPTSLPEDKSSGQDPSDKTEENASEDKDNVVFHIQGAETSNEENAASTAEEVPEMAPLIVPEGEHALQTGWCFWYDKKLPKHADVNEYKSHLHNLGAFHTIEGFWRYYVHLKRPSALEVNTNLYLFRHGENMVPMWESFPNGGSWILKLRKKSSSGPSVLSKLWQDLVLGAIGEAFCEPDVVGIGLSVRTREDLLSVWNADNSNDQVRFLIGEKLKTILGLEENTMIEYKTFKASLQDMSSFRNAKPYVFAVQQSPKKH